MISREKQLLRQQMRDCLRDMLPERMNLASKVIAALIKSSDYFRTARCVFCFWPMPSEPQILEAMHGTVHIGLPRIDGATMSFFQVDPDTSVVYNKLGMHEPPEGAVLLLPEQADIILLPALALDLKGGRLGRGGGYYDRFLKNPNLRARRIGVCFSCQVVEELPIEAHDQLVDAIVTEEGVFPSTGRGLEAQAACRFP